MGATRATPLPSMQMGALDWLLAGSTVALCIALVAAPVALTPRIASLYALHGALEARSTLSRLMMSSWLPPLLAAGPMAVAIRCTVTRMTARRRRWVLAVALLLALLATLLFAQGLVSPVLSVASGAG
jgi:hypothetical protein